MEDDIGTLFYIILMVIALIITVLGRKRKQKAAAPISTEGETAAADPFQAFNLDNIETETELSDPLTVTTTEIPPVQSVLDKIAEEGVPAFNEGPVPDESIDIRFKEDMATIDQEYQSPGDLSKPYETRKEVSELDKIMKEFDLKKAVILSEIINRKEF